MMSKEKIKMFGSIFTAVLMVVLVGIGVLAVSSNDATPPTQSEPASTLRAAVNLPAVVPSPSATPSPVAMSTSEPEPPQENLNPYAGIALTDQERVWLCCMAYSEAGNQELDGQVAVVQVALNRLMHEKFPSDVESVLFQPNQFCVGGTYTEAQEEAVEAALMGHPALDLNTDVVFFSTGSLCYGSYYKTIGAHVFRTYS